MRHGVQLYIAALCLLLLGCDRGVMSTEIPLYKLKVTAEVDTPEGVRSGYAVSEHRGHISRLRSAEISPFNGSVSGEAVAVDLPGGKTLFVVNECRNSAYACAAFGGGVIPYETLPGYVETDMHDTYARNIETARQGSEAIRKAVGTTAVMPPAYYPMMVRFGDPANPETVEEVDPANLAASFGKGYAIRKITVEITDEPVTRGMRQRLPWIDTLQHSLVERKQGQMIGDMPAAHKLVPGYFSFNMNRVKE